MKYIPSIAFEEMSGSAKGVTAAPKVFLRYFFVNTKTAEKSGEMLGQISL